MSQPLPHAEWQYAKPVVALMAKESRLPRWIGHGARSSPPCVLRTFGDAVAVVAANLGRGEGHPAPSSCERHHSSIDCRL